MSAESLSDLNAMPARRMAHARRAAAPSVDFSMLPVSPAMQALLDAANAPAPVKGAPPPPPRAHAAPDSRDVPETPRNPTVVPLDEDDAADPMDVPDTFRFRSRPRGERTLQPFDVPDPTMAAPPEDRVDAAEAFLRAHLQGPTRTAAYTRPPAAETAPRVPQSQIPTLVLDLPGPAAPAPETPPLAAAPSPAEPPPTRRPTAKLHAFAYDNDHVDEVPLELVPAAEVRARPGTGRSGRLDTDLIDWLDSDESDSILIDDPVDPELDDWMKARSRGRFLALLGALAAMFAVGALALLGLAVVAGPLLLSADAPAAVTEAPPPPPAAAPQRVLTVEKGDTFTRLLADQPVDALAVHTAALPVHDLSKLEPGDRVTLVLDPAGKAVNAVRVALPDGRTLVVDHTPAGWTARAK